MSDKLINVAVVGATGAVGELMIKILEERNFPVGELFPLASVRSMGKTVEFKGKPCAIMNLAEFDFSRAQLALFSAGGGISEEYVPQAIEQGCFVIDNTSFFRMQDDIPLIISEVNPEALTADAKMIANPNCSTMGLLVGVKPIHDKFGVARMNVTTFQAVSGAGKSGISALSKQTIEMMRMQEISEDEYPPFAGQIAFNALPHIGTFLDNGYTDEEMKMVNETHKIFGDDSIGVNVTCVRVPVFYGHSMTVTLELKTEWQMADLVAAMEQAPGLSVKNENQAKGYPVPLLDGSGKDDVFVGRIRQDLSNPKCVTFWLVSDNVRKGAALNSVQLAELAKETGHF